MVSVEDFMASLGSKDAKAVTTAANLDIERLATPSVGINMQIQGGFRYGAQNMLWGNRSGGKTVFALLMIAEAQRQGKLCAFIDVEGSYTPEWGARLGVDNDKLIYKDDIKTIAKMADLGVKWLKAGIDVLVIDSISALQPGSFFDKNGEAKDFQDTGQIGTFSKEIGRMCGMFNNFNKNTCLILISQVTTGIYNWGSQDEPQGGRKAMHFNDTSIKLTSSMTEKNQIEGDISVGDMVFKKFIGRHVTWKIDKARGPGMNATDTYDLYFDGDMVGIDNVAELIPLAVQHGKIIRKGGWYEIPSEDQKFQGGDNVANFLRDNIQLVEEWYDEITGA